MGFVEAAAVELLEGLWVGIFIGLKMG